MDDDEEVETVEIELYPGFLLDGCFGQYAIKDFINRGAYSDVFSARNQETKKDYAIKFIRYHADALMETNLLLVINKEEMKYAKYICRLCDQVVIPEPNCIGLVLERGACSLLDIMDANNLKPLHIRHVRSIMLQLFSALDSLHSIQIVHVDIKPENILVKDTTLFFRGALERNKATIELFNVEIMLCDFNCSKFIPEWNQNASEILQTFHYRAPEVILGITKGRPIDVFSAGVMLAELASGFLVFDMYLKNVAVPNVTERAEHLRLLERVLGACPKYLYQKSPFDYFNTGQWLIDLPLNSEYSWYQDWVSEKTIEAMDQGQGVLDLIGSTMCWPDQRLTAEQAIVHPFFTENDPPTGLFYKDMKKISLEELLLMKQINCEMDADTTRSSQISVYYQPAAIPVKQEPMREKADINLVHPIN